MKIAYLFPGQGSQYVGMGKEFIQEDGVEALFKKAEHLLGINMRSLCFEGPEDQLKLTEYTQPAILLISYIAYKLLYEQGIKARWAAGHSLGEYSALIAAGAISFEDAITVVRKRGKFMQEAVPLGIGAMAAVIGLESGKIDELCSDVNGIGYVKAANYNSPVQTVVSGDRLAVEELMKKAKESGAKMAIMLPVSAPFHSSLIKDAEYKLTEELKKIDFLDLIIPVITNVDAQPVHKGNEAMDSLSRQICSPVRWVESIKYLIGQGVDTFIELGPGKVLTGLIKRIDNSATAYNVGDMVSLEKTVSSIKQMV